MIYDPARHEPLTAARWDEAHVREAIAAIVADAEGAVGRDGLWPPHRDDVEDDGVGPWTTVYLGSAGIAWALRRLGSRLDVRPIHEEALRRYREQPDFGEAIPGLFLGESGIELTARLAGAAGASLERLRELVLANERNPAWEPFWGSAGTAVAAREGGLVAEYERSAAILLEEWDGIWTQVIEGRTSQYLGPAHGFAGNVHTLRGFVPDDELRRRVEPVLREHAVSEGGLVNWPPVVGSDCSRVQWCHGAPGIVITLADLMPVDLVLGGAELTWQAGPVVNGCGLCHGTAGNGYALLRAHAVTGEDEWLDRARRFAMHALEQAERKRAEHGRGRYSLFTGDVGAALYAQSCLTVDARFPTMDVW